MKGTSKIEDFTLVEERFTTKEGLDLGTRIETKSSFGIKDL